VKGWDTIAATALLAEALHYRSLGDLAWRFGDKERSSYWHNTARELERKSRDLLTTKNNQDVEKERGL
jgi:hypothetical protein